MAAPLLDIWCKEVVLDPVAETDNRRVIVPEEYENGWIRLGTVSTQQANSLFHIISLNSPPYPHSPYLMRSSIPTPDTALDMNGSTFLEVDAPNLYSIYGGTLDDMAADAPTNYKYVIRKS